MNGYYGLDVYNRVDVAISRLQEFCPPEGYHLAFSGGKDSIVLLDLAKKAGVKYDVHMSLTTVDPPELIKYVKKHYSSEVEFDKPALSMFQLIEKKLFPPTRKFRYCCRVLKETRGSGRIVLTGVRHQESYRRAKRKLVEFCLKDGHRRFVHPIIDWTNTEIWEYILVNKIPYCSLYDEGYRRIGCIGCPMASKKERKKEFERWPRYKDRYLKSFDRLVQLRKDMGKELKDFKTGQQLFDWWMNDFSRPYAQNDDSEGYALIYE